MIKNLTLAVFVGLSYLNPLDVLAKEDSRNVTTLLTFDDCVLIVAFIAKICCLPHSAVPVKKDQILLYYLLQTKLTLLILSKLREKKYVNKVTERESKFFLNDFHIIHQI